MNPNPPASLTVPLGVLGATSARLRPRLFERPQGNCKRVCKTTLLFHLAYCISGGSSSGLSQRSPHNAPIFRLLLKVAVRGTHQCDSQNFCAAFGLQSVSGGVAEPRAEQCSARQRSTAYPQCYAARWLSQLGTVCGLCPPLLQSLPVHLTWRQPPRYAQPHP
jgi:hypothetical protein